MNSKFELIESLFPQFYTLAWSMGARKLTIRYFNKEREKDYVVYCVLVD